MISFRNITKELSILASLSIFVALLVNFMSPSGIALFGSWDTSRGVISAGGPNNVITHELEITSPAEAKEIFDTAKAVFLDARSEDLYEETHIQGAVSFPVHRFDDLIMDFFEKYPFDRFIITYCSGRECDDSHRLAVYLKDAGYTRIKVYIDGISGWEKEGYPVE